MQDNAHDLAYEVLIGHLKSIMKDEYTVEHWACDAMCEYINVAIGSVVKAHRENGRMWDLGSTFTGDMKC